MNNNLAALSAGHRGPHQDAVSDDAVRCLVAGASATSTYLR